MMAFGQILSEIEIKAVANYVIVTFVNSQGTNTRYHIEANGWIDHQRYKSAYPFVRGQLVMDQADEQLSVEQRQGKQIYLSSCILCHEPRTQGGSDKVGIVSSIWERRAVSYPRGDMADAVSSATPYRHHDVPPVLGHLTTQEREGERLFQHNCAFCHAADGSAGNWVGSFLQPAPRDFTNAGFWRKMTVVRLKEVIANGLPGTTMSAWKSVMSADQIDATIAYMFQAFYSSKVEQPAH